jgi:hypothetical protein
MVTPVGIAILAIIGLVATVPPTAMTMISLRERRKRRRNREVSYLVEIDPRTQWRQQSIEDNIKNKAFVSQSSLSESLYKTTTLVNNWDEESLAGLTRESTSSLSLEDAKYSRYQKTNNRESLETFVISEPPSLERHRETVAHALSDNRSSRVRSQCAMLVLDETDDGFADNAEATFTATGIAAYPSRMPAYGLAIDGVELPTSPAELSFADSSVDPSIYEAECVTVATVQMDDADAETLQNPFSDSKMYDNRMPLTPPTYPESAYFSPQSVDEFEFPQTPLAPVGHESKGIQKLAFHPYEIELSIFDSFVH